MTCYITVLVIKIFPSCNSFSYSMQYFSNLWTTAWGLVYPTNRIGYLKISEVSHYNQPTSKRKDAVWIVHSFSMPADQYHRVKTFLYLLLCFQRIANFQWVQLFWNFCVQVPLGFKSSIMDTYLLWKHHFQYCLIYRALTFQKQNFQFSVIAQSAWILLNKMFHYVYWESRIFTQFKCVFSVKIHNFHLGHWFDLRTNWIL